ncbi:alkaline phosphatase family protein [Dyadobacter aurulentus]|uniref:alkaline phosphatase family protein n=1 Tax=Dyadobacter sp. UC 10 TaxID=2605428 RepID=UPI0011F13A2A|nr:alkaline phosphatase family protein [Dyadobacter sp. UC 10]KAA0989072.1 alkaline phosphatase family protein [Dyadobacter sp. UC 10]
MKRITTFFKVTIVLVLAISTVFGQAGKETSNTRNKTLIVFFDGLRPDYITREQMPNLFAFKETASFAKNHHSVFPTVTRVNSASYATGSYPGTHGLLGNAIYIPEVDPLKSIGTGHEDLIKIPGATGGSILTSPSLGEILESAGEKMMVFSSGTTGQAFLQNHQANGTIINPELILPETFKTQVLAEIGEVPREVGEGLAKHKWVTDALLKYGLAKDGPLVSAIWLSDPDGAAHKNGIGSPEAVEAIRFVDGQFGRILEAMQSRGLDGKYNIIISTDHGFVTQIGSISLTDFLIQEGLKKDKESDDVILAEGSIYVKNHDPELIRKIVASLQEEEWIGAIFTKAKQAGDNHGWVEGTLSFDAIHFNHPQRTGDILVAKAWNDVKNEKGFAGTDYSKGKAGHGGSSPYEIHINLFAKGPDFKNGAVTELPTSNIDIVPTILSIYHIQQSAQMDGRSISELLKKPSRATGTVQKELIKTEVTHDWGTYFLTLEMSVLGRYKYFDFSKTERVFKK